MESLTHSPQDEIAGQWWAKVCARAEQRMMQTGKLEGAHYAAATELLPELTEVMKSQAARIRELETTATAFWDLLDAIDTVSDMAKGDDAGYRRAVERLHRRRFEYATTDGYTLTWLTSPSQPCDHGFGRVVGLGVMRCGKCNQNYSLPNEPETTP